MSTELEFSSHRRRGPGTIRLLLVDDHRLYVESLTLALATESRFEIVGHAGDGRAALDLVPPLRPDVILMDLEMPRMGGLEATACVRAIAPDVKVIVVSSASDPDSVERAFAAGAAGFVGKDRPTRELVETIFAVADRARPCGLRFFVGDPDASAAPSPRAGREAPSGFEPLYEALQASA